MAESYCYTCRGKMNSVHTEVNVDLCQIEGHPFRNVLCLKQHMDHYVCHYLYENSLKRYVCTRAYNLNLLIRPMNEPGFSREQDRTFLHTSQY